MGAWDELDTEISVEVDTSDLDVILDFEDEYGILEPAKEYVEKLKTAIEEGSSKAINLLATWDRSWQEQIILDKCKNPSGMLASSINIELEEYSALIGTDINHIYPLCVEFGRGEVHPIPPNTRLRFYGEDGYLIYPLFSRKADPVPFVAPAYEKLNEVAEEGMLIEIGKLLPK